MTLRVTALILLTASIGCGPSGSSGSSGSGAAAGSSQSAASAPAVSAPTPRDARAVSSDTPLLASLPQEPMAGELFGMPVSQSNYYFAKRVAYMFERPWGVADLPEDQREVHIWEQLILHYEAFRRGIDVSEAEIAQRIDAFLKSQEVSFTRSSDPAGYRTWVTEQLSEPVELFENQVHYLLQIQALKDRIRKEAPVTVAEEELQQEFLNEKHHVAGEMVVFETQEAAQQFYDQVKDPAAWEAMKAAGERQIRPVSMMTLEAYIDLWSIAREQMYAFHALDIGSIGPPMPFGRQWCVYRLLDKRTGDLADFPAEREAYVRQVETKKKYEALQQWIAQLKDAAGLRIFPLEPAGATTASTE